MGPSLWPRPTVSAMTESWKVDFGQRRGLYSPQSPLETAGLSTHMSPPLCMVQGLPCAKMITKSTSSPQFGTLCSECLGGTELDEKTWPALKVLR